MAPEKAGQKPVTIARTHVIITILAALFVLALGVDLVLWYVVHKSALARQALQEVVGSQPKAPETNEERAAVLNELTARSREMRSIQSSTSDHPVPSTDQQRQEILDSLTKQPQH